MIVAFLFISFKVLSVKDYYMQDIIYFNNIDNIIYNINNILIIFNNINLNNI